jgi:hypothetical protein
MDVCSTCRHGLILLENRSMEGDTPVMNDVLLCTNYILRVGLLGNAALSRW